MDDEGRVIRKGPCPSCGSRDNLATYDDGHSYCFGMGCGYREAGDGQVTRSKASKVSVSTKESLQPYFDAKVEAIPERKLSRDTNSLFGVRVGLFKGQKAHFYPYIRDGEVVACKVRMAGKEFTFIGDAKAPPMFGANLWNKGKKLVITEGEIDALTVSQAQGNKWPVVSIPNGASGAARDIKKNSEFFEPFEEIILMFDGDEAGRAAAAAVAPLFAPGKVKVATLPLKDANACLMGGQAEAIIPAIWNAKPYRPDGIVEIDDAFIEECDVEDEPGIPWCLPELTRLTYGRRLGEVYGIGAGTGIGKTDFITQQIAFDIEDLGEKVGIIFMEQKPKDTVYRLAGKLAGKRFHVPDGSWTREERKLWMMRLKAKALLYNSFGETKWEVIKAKIRYMAHAGCRIIYVDHLTAMADTADEKNSLDQIMKEMAGAANELNVMIFFVSHLATPEGGKSHEEGASVSIRHFKGSRNIGSWAHAMFGLERNQQHPDIALRNITLLRILKDRLSGDSTGTVIRLGYDRVTGRIYEAPPEEEPPSKFKDESNDEESPF